MTRCAIVWFITGGVTMGFLLKLKQALAVWRKQRRLAKEWAKKKEWFK